jgi:predicted nuclease of predicted toxin-antitoxin system
MPWQTIPDPDHEEVARFRRARRSRFLIDESLGSGTIEFFERLRLNAVDVWQVGLNGRDDRAVFAFAWRHRRILLTHDEDFWDDRRFPEHRNPGLVILPGANGDQTDMISGLWWMTQLMDCNPELWSKKKSALRVMGRSMSAVVTGVREQWSPNAFVSLVGATQWSSSGSCKGNARTALAARGRHQDRLA